MLNVEEDRTAELRSAGKALLQQVAAIAVEKGCKRLQWAVLDWNTPAIDFYRAMGAEFMDEWRSVRVSEDALMRLAGITEMAAPGQTGSNESINKSSEAAQ